MYKSGQSLILLCCTTSYLVLGQTSAVLLPQLQNFSHAQEEFLLLCYHKSRMFLTRQKFCCSVTTVAECFSLEKYSALVTTIAECFSPEKYSALLLPQLQNVSHQRNTLLLWYHNCRMFLPREKFCCLATTRT